MSLRAPLKATALALLLAAAPLGAQTVRGAVVDAGTGRPVVGTLVVLLDAAGKQRAAMLTDGGGRYSLDVPGAGRYTLRAERVGRESTLSPPLDLAPGEVREVRLEANPRVFTLEAVQVRSDGDRGCAVRPAGGTETAALWEEARKAFNSAAWTGAASPFRYSVAEWTRSLAPGSMAVRTESRSDRTAVARHPFASIDPDSLSARGYVRVVPDGTLYYGPDVRTLDSESFLADHCFELAPAQFSEPTLVGLAFEPVRGRRVPDIAGAMWIDRTTGELRRVDYHYVNLRSNVAADLGGRVEFRRLPNGAWIVQRWRIRTPELAVSRDVERIASGSSATGGGRERLTGIREVEGLVTEVVTRTGEPITEPAAGAAIAGMVLDSATARPLAGARVFVSGTQYSSVSDENGRFRIDGLAGGDYTVSFSHPWLDSLGVSPNAARVSVRSGDSATVALSVPRPVQRVAAARPPAAAPVDNTDYSAAERLAAAVAARQGKAAASRPAGEGSMADFNRRAERGSGVYVKRADIVRRRPNRTLDLFRGVPQVQVGYAGGGATGTLRFIRHTTASATLGSAPAGADASAGVGSAGQQRAQGSPVSTDVLDRMRDASGSADPAVTAGTCVPVVWIDGLLSGSPETDLDALLPSQVEGIEIYTSVSNAPPQYRPGTAECGVVLVWTRQYASRHPAATPR
ncbi:MAG TPA: carboxypeptidase regulatory-like domain-containing protein [Longimicrobiaceae bacterium]|jgi:hypothetical protein|nr:carboxypeptidase regulatory-like domain-containing protein [Longimicrobiaceae bacterium]